MGLSIAKKVELLRIKAMRSNLERLLNSNFIKESDIEDLFNKGYKLDNDDSYKNEVLKEILNNPFILCDQISLSESTKELLPDILRKIYTKKFIEGREQYVLGNISKEDLEKKEDMLDFCYFKTSQDGKSILNTGHVKRKKVNKD